MLACLGVGVQRGIASCGIFALVTLSDATACDRVRVGGASNWYPIVMRSEDRASVHGLAPDVAAEVFQRLDIRLVVERDLPWKRLMLRLDQGKLDAILGAYWNEERAARYAYTLPFARDEIAIFVPKDRQFELAGLDDLIGRFGLRPLGGSYGEVFDSYAERFLNIEQVASPGRNTIIRMLAGGRADYAVLGRYDGLEDIRDSGLKGQVVDLPLPVVSNDVHFLFSRKSACIDRLEDINAAIRALNDEGVISRLEARYLY